ncbi:hypothetical protein ALNOE001_14640 [Candidatus Methanobinarius endosymbioticus]|uniref:Acetyltransferase n=1 Tax=Candidatus Methanobinarius endosymbioticus TaxID=2006182 RepID=A0A366M9I2_9EURY|nr:hypothetical protein ALNOE001_14640 [Candidatus Methanobinarius endosymbioticus]
MNRNKINQVNGTKMENIDQIIKIWLECNIKSHYFISEDYWRSNKESILNEYLPKSKTFTYKENNEIKGFISSMSNDLLNKKTCENSKHI